MGTVKGRLAQLERQLEQGQDENERELFAAFVRGLTPAQKRMLRAVVGLSTKAYVGVTPDDWDQGGEGDESEP